jgi:hypothetical protein
MKTKTDKHNKRQQGLKHMVNAANRLAESAYHPADFESIVSELLDCIVVQMTTTFNHQQQTKDAAQNLIDFIDRTQRIA